MVLALLAALITVWLGIVAQFGAAVAAQAETVPAELAVVRVQTGETLEHLAARVAPGAPTSRVAATIRELNGLDSAVLEAGRWSMTVMAGPLERRSLVRSMLRASADILRTRYRTVVEHLIERVRATRVEHVFDSCPDWG
ncbi:hypothetical protein A5643_01785 [Mycobacterium sp. 1274756.6]|nr:hypothetical protein A5643_01785 [Mycobacterium sp. 1274756.6]